LVRALTNTLKLDNCFVDLDQDDWFTVEKPNDDAAGHRESGV